MEPYGRRVASRQLLTHPRLVAWPAACVPTILALRDIAPQQTTTFAILGLAAAFTSFVFSFEGKVHRFAIPAPVLFLGFILMAMTALAAAYGAVSSETLLGLLLVFLTAGLAGTALARTAKTPGDIVRVAAAALGVLVVTSTVLWWLGFESQSDYGATGTSGSLFFEIRTLFPLTFGYTSHAAVCGAALVASLPFWREKHWWPVIFCSVLGLLLADGRAALFGGVPLVLLALRFVPSRFIPLGGVLLIASAPAFLIASAVLPDSALSLISRTGSIEEIRSGNNRMEVWSKVIEEVQDNPASFLHGYGYYGQAASGISRNYAFVFRGWRGDLTFYSVHNAGMQILVDGGIFALLAFFMWYSWMLGSFNRSSPTGTAAINLIIYALIVGAMDTTGTPQQREIFFALLLLSFAAMRANPYVQRKRRVRYGAYPRAYP